MCQGLAGFEICGPSAACGPLRDSPTHAGEKAEVEVSEAPGRAILGESQEFPLLHISKLEVEARDIPMVYLLIPAIDLVLLGTGLASLDKFSSL